MAFQAGGAGGSGFELSLTYSLLGLDVETLLRNAAVSLILF